MQDNVIAAIMFIHQDCASQSIRTVQRESQNIKEYNVQFKSWIKPSQTKSNNINHSKITFI